jgi:aspartate racemase
MYKTIGILGGMGPAATVDLMNKITEMTDAKRDQDHVRILVDSNTNIPDRTDAILHGGEDPVPQMLESARLLEAAGADFLIIPCNTAHYFIPQIKDEINIPILDMHAETARLLADRGIRKAAVLATDGTVQSGLYEKVLSEYDIKVVYPLKEQQKTVMSLVYDFIKRGVKDRGQLPVIEMAKITDDLRRRGAEVLLLACTELPLAFSYMHLYEDDCFDPTRELAAAAIRAAGAPVRQNSGY